MNVIVLQNNPYALLHFSFSDATTGTVLVQLFKYKDAQGTTLTASSDAVDHFIELATHKFDSNGDIISGAPFYTDVVVHRIIDGFMFQTGDAVNGDGTGGSTLRNTSFNGDQIALQDSFDPLFNFGGPGVLAMANSGPNTSDSQFFITESAYASGDQKYIIFGQMIGSDATFDKLMSQPIVPGTDRPVTPPILTSVEILENHTEDAVVILKPINGFTGDTSVTFTLTDTAGHTTEQVVNVTAAKDFDVRVEPGVAKSFHVDISGLNAPTITSGLSQATVSLDPLTGLVTVKAPADFSGPFVITLNDGDTGVQDYFIFAQGAGDPAIVDYMPTTGFSFLCSVQQGDLLYAGIAPVGSTAGGIEIYDISNPEKPVLLSTIHYSVRDGDTLSDPFYYVMDMKLQGNTLYVVDTDYEGAGHFTSIDVSDPSLPFVSDPELTYSVHSIPAVATPFALEISGNTAFVVNRKNGSESLAAIDISDPANLKQYDNLFSTLPAGLTGLTINQINDVAVNGNYAYLSSVLYYAATDKSYGTIITVDISNPANMKFVGWSGSNGYAPLGMDIENNVLYVTEGNGAQVSSWLGPAYTYGRVSSYSLSSPAAPKYLSSIDLPSNGWQIDVQDGMALVMPDDGTQFIFMDVSDPLHMHVNSVAYNQVAGDGWGLKPSLSSTLAVGPVAGTGTFLFDASSLGDPQWIITRGTLFDENGTAVTISVSGGGNVRVIQDATGHFEEIALVGGTSASKLTIATPSRRTTAVDAIVIEGSAASVTARTTSLLESMTVSGTLGGLTLDDVGDADPATAPVTIDIHTNSSVTPVSTLAMSITLGDVSDTLLTVRGIPVKSLGVSTWSDVDGDPSNDNITAKRLDKLSAKGDFAAGLDINAGGSSTSAVSLGSATLGGGASGAWNITGSTGGIKVTGQADGLEVRATGNIASLTLGAARDSNFLAGFDQTFTYPHAIVAGDFAPSLLSSIGAITISGLKVPRNTVPPRFLENTNFSAAHIGKVTLKNVDIADTNLDDPNLTWGLWAAGTGTLSGITSVKTSDTDPAKKGNLYNWSWRSTSPTTPDVIHLLVTSGPAPTVAGISPSTGPLAGGTMVTITGTNLLDATAVYFGNKLVPIVNPTATQIVVASPEGVAGTVDITVVTAGGRSATSAADRFTYQAVGVALSLVPVTSVNLGGTLGVVNVVNVVLTANSASDVVGGVNLQFTGNMIQIEAPVWDDETGTYVGTVAPITDVYSQSTGPDGNPYTITGNMVNYSSHFLLPASAFVYTMSNPAATITDTTYTPAITCTSPGALQWSHDGVGDGSVIPSPTELAHLSNSMSVAALIDVPYKAHQIIIAQIVYRASDPAPIVNGDASDGDSNQSNFTNVAITYVPV